MPLALGYSVSILVKTVTVEIMNVACICASCLLLYILYVQYLHSCTHQIPFHSMKPSGNSKLVSSKQYYLLLIHTLVLQYLLDLGTVAVKTPS